MSDMVAWIGAEAERPKIAESAGFPRRRRQGEDQRPARDLPADEVLRERVPVKETEPTQEMVEDFSFQQRLREEEDRERERRTYRARTVAMLRRYMRYSIETGRLPSLLGREFFRGNMTSYTVGKFEDPFIFVHDMEKCLEKLDEFSRQLIARHMSQEHDQAAAGKLLQSRERTVRS